MKKLSKIVLFGGLPAILAGIFFVGIGSAQVGGDSLNLANPGIQLMNLVWSPDYTDFWASQHIFQSGAYHSAWQSAPLPGRASIRIGDIDNDGQREVVASAYFVTGQDIVRKKVVATYYSCQVLVYENGAAYGAPPNFGSLPMGELKSTLILDTAIGDVDNLGMPGSPHNELVMARSWRLSICRYINGDWTLEDIWTFPTTLYSVEVGDADNDGQNEIITSCSGTPIVLKFVEGSWISLPVDPVPTEYYGDGMSSLGLLFAKVRDIDNAVDPNGGRDNEIIACGNNSRAMAWKYDGTGFRLSAISDDLGGFNSHGIDAGDIDNDGNNEIAISTWGANGKKKTDPKIHILSYAVDPSGPYDRLDVVDSFVSPSHIYYLGLGDLDTDYGLEVAVHSYNDRQVRIFDFISGGFYEVYVASGDGSSKLEIR